MDEFWQRIRGLLGKTLHMLDQGKPFAVSEVTDEICLEVVPAGDPARAKVRMLYRKDLAPLYRRLAQDRALDVQEIKRTIAFNSSYSAALLASADGVVARTRPIRLFHRPTIKSR